MGISAGEEGEDDGILTRDVTPRASPPVPNAMLPNRSMHIDKDPIWAISKHEALRLVHVWHEEMGVMYPILEVGKVLRYTDMLFTFVEAAARSGLMQGALPGSDAMMDEQISVLKLVLAITLVLEGGGKDPLGEKLFANVHKVVDKALSEPVSLHGITLLVLTVSRVLLLSLALLTRTGHVSLHTRRRGFGVASGRIGCATLSGARLASPRYLCRSFSRPRRASVGHSHLLDHLRARSPLEFWDRNAVCSARC